MARRKRAYPAFEFFVVPPDPRRKSPHLVIITQESRYAPLELYCCADCVERGKAKPDGSCRHTDFVRAALKPYWQRRARAAVATGRGGKR